MANEPRFEVYPRREVGYVTTGSQVTDRLTEYGWRFRAANGQITAIGGEGFSREEDAERAIADFLLNLDPGPPSGSNRAPIMRVDE